MDTDTTRLALGGYELDLEARKEVKRILNSRRQPLSADLRTCELPEFMAWQVSVGGDFKADVVALGPGGLPSGLPSATEVRLVQAADLLPRDDFQRLLIDGGLLIVGEDPRDLSGLDGVFSSVRRRGPSPTALMAKSSLDIDIGRVNFPASSKSISIFAQACKSEPIKYHFLEVYRSMEIQFLHEILKDFQSDFFTKPKPAIEAVKKALESEVNQVIRLTQYSSINFEEICDRINNLDASGNTFAVALKDKHRRNGSPGAGRSDHGAVFVYYIRCAIVHAGDKDIIYEQHQDADDLLSDVLLYAELAALEIAGVRCL